MTDQPHPAKENELIEFLRANSSALRMNAPTLGAVKETMAALAMTDPEMSETISGEEFAKLLVKRYPELRFEWIGGEQAEELSPDQPATERQISYLKVLGAPIPGILSVREASDLIDKWKNKVSDAQKRRLDFYQLSYDSNITREQANTLIDRYKQANPGSEEAYQKWKIDNGIA
jgi:hypothetical protein